MKKVLLFLLACGTYVVAMDKPDSSLSGILYSEGYSKELLDTIVNRLVALEKTVYRFQEQCNSDDEVSDSDVESWYATMRFILNENRKLKYKIEEKNAKIDALLEYINSHGTNFNIPTLSQEECASRQDLTSHKSSTTPLSNILCDDEQEV